MAIQRPLLTDSLMIGRAKTISPWRTSQTSPRGCSTPLMCTRIGSRAPARGGPLTTDALLNDLGLPPGVLVVAGVPDAYRGETVKAFIVLRPGATASAEEIVEFSRLHLAAFKVPRKVEFRSELPKSMVGKYLRRVLVEEERAPEAPAP